MSIWKSPVFYFGVLLTLLVSAALAAPYVVEWNNYRGQLEVYGRKLSGREVTIGGDIAVKLFPYPQLEAHDVAVGNADGFANVPFLQAEVMRVRLSLGGLFNGSLDVENIETEKPILNLQRNASGDVNWYLAPEERVTGAGLLSRVKLDQIDVRSGVVTYDDLKTGHSTFITGVNATLSAQSILGPWRVRGDVRWNDVPLQVNVTTSAKQPDVPTNFTIKIAPADVILPQMALEGAWDGKVFDGTIRVDPQAQTGEKTSAEGTFKPLSLQAKMEISESRISLLKIRVAPFDRKDNGTLIEGAAVVEFGAQTVAQVDLKSPRINLDTLLGAGTMQQWREGGLLQVANLVLAKMPAKMIAEFKLNVSVLTSGGQALNDVRLTGNVQPEAIRVHDFTAELPGRSTGQFNGIIFPGEKAAQLGGKLSFQSQDMRAFSSWLLPDWKESFAQHWTGNRGQLSIASSTLHWSILDIAMKDIVYEFDGVAGKAAVAQGFGAQPKTSITIDAGDTNLDALFPNGLSVLRDGGLPAIASLVARQQGNTVSENEVTFRAKSVLLNGVRADAVNVDFAAGAKGFQLKLLDIGNVSGAKLSSGGNLTDQGNGLEGEIQLNLIAQDPRGFLRLTGLEYGASSWADVLGQTTVETKITAVPQKSGPEIEIVTRGSSGAINMELVARLRELENGRSALIAASGGLNSVDSAALAKLVGVIPAISVGAGDVTFEFNGSLENGFVLGANIKALDAVARVDGNAKPELGFFGFNGSLSAEAADGRAILGALGIPLAANATEPLRVQMTVHSNDDALVISELKGELLGRGFSGSAELSSTRRLQGDVATDRLDVQEAMALVFMPWAGAAKDLSNNFADMKSPRWTGDFFIRPQVFETGTSAAQKEVVVGLGFEAAERRLSISAPGDEAIKADVVLKPRGDSYDMSADMRWLIDLPQHLKVDDGTLLAVGQMIVDGQLKASGRSVASMLAALEGSGDFKLKNASFPRLTLDGFSQAVLNAKTPDALSAALLLLNQKPGLSLGEQAGRFEAKNGEFKLSELLPQVQNLSTRVSTAFDAASNALRIETVIAIPSRPDLPEVSVTYAGPVGALAIRNGSSALAAKLGYELLSIEMARLERLQQEQQALLAKEEAQRVEDEKRFIDYQATKAELRMQARVRRFHNAEREKTAVAMQAIVDEALKINVARTRQELARHARRLAVRRGGAL